MSSARFTSGLCCYCPDRSRSGMTAGPNPPNTARLPATALSHSGALAIAKKDPRASPSTSATAISRRSRTRRLRSDPAGSASMALLKTVPIWSEKRFEARPRSLRICRLEASRCFRYASLISVTKRSQYSRTISSCVCRTASRAFLRIAFFEHCGERFKRPNGVGCKALDRLFLLGLDLGQFPRCVQE